MTSRISYDIVASSSMFDWLKDGYAITTRIRPGISPPILEDHPKCTGVYAKAGTVPVSMAGLDRVSDQKDASPRSPAKLPGLVRLR